MGQIQKSFPDPVPPFPGTVLRVSYDIARISLRIETVVQGHMPLAEGAVTLRWLMDVGGFP